MAALPPLITSEDIAEYGYPDEAAAFIARASARVRAFTGQQITYGTSTVTLYAVSPVLLPQRPIVEITSVVDATGSDVEWKRSGQMIACDRYRSPLTVTYSHGYQVIPDPVVELVASVCGRMNATPDTIQAGVRTEMAGGESVTWGQDAFKGTSGLTVGEETILKRLFPRYPRSVLMNPGRFLL